ncbi:hypothetical protein [Halobaculum gomorrense]|uniref:Uncharacterized protein n=1 Tax=Halobaculum gomorrense TaxID=43928 RepID=A0A1M5M7Y1_9EURY|nr:hypothetical protein [Halobaculum gomorrense]SHG73348.1 hypothetical protein SAMN05443636_0915 [Halobaculum gomorrense]
MATEDTGWRPTGGLQQYKGYEVWEYDHGPQEENQGETDGEVDLDGTERLDDE